LDPGIYCEWCLCVANQINQLRKKGKIPSFEPEEEIERLLEEAWKKEEGLYG
jgi:hypothetical protein